MNKSSADEIVKTEAHREHALQMHACEISDKTRPAWMRMKRIANVMYVQSVHISVTLRLMPLQMQTARAIMVYFEKWMQSMNENNSKCSTGATHAWNSSIFLLYTLWGLDGWMVECSDGSECVWVCVCENVAVGEMLSIIYIYIYPSIVVVFFVHNSLTAARGSVAVLLLLLLRLHIF